MVYHKDHKVIGITSDLNIISLDDVPCKVCGKVPPIFKRKKQNEFGVEFECMDRSSRVDCDSGSHENSILVTYCKDCYWKEVRKRKQ